MRKLNFLVIPLAFAFFAFCVSSPIGASAQNGKVAQEVMKAKAQQQDFESYQIFSTTTTSARTDYSAAVTDGILFDLDQALVGVLRADNPRQMTLRLPFLNNGTIDLELVRVKIHDDDFRFMTSDGRDLTYQVDLGLHYRGMIAGNSNSLVSISVFNNEVSGFIADDNSKYTLGKLTDSESTHILYEDSDLRTSFSLNCGVVDDENPYAHGELVPSAERDAGDCIKVMWHLGFDLYQNFGEDPTATGTWLFGLTAESYTLYANQGIWVETITAYAFSEDEGSYADTDEYLDFYQSYIGGGDLEGNVGHYIELDNVGGLAAGFDGLCNGDVDESLCFSGMSGTDFNTVPTWSFNVYIITHEMGHLFGSRHTHACVWNGDNTAIDGCAGYTDFPHADCPLPGSPAGGGTLMSYCNSDPVGIDFTLGFHDQPLAAIMNDINNASCLDVCPCNPDITDPDAQCQDVIIQLNVNGNGSTTAGAVNNGSSDGCGGVTLALSKTSFNCSNVGGNSVTLTVTDESDNTDACSATVTVVDNIAPVALCKNITVQLDAGGSTSISASDIDNGSNDACGVSLALISDAVGFTCSDVGTNNVTLYVTDPSGNQSTCVSVVTVEDNVPPVALCKDISIFLDLSCTVSIDGIDVDNGSHDACGIASYVVVPDFFDTGDVGDNPVVLTVTDVNGNSASCNAIVTVMRRPTTLTNLGDFDGQYSDYPVLQAELIDDLSGTPLPGKTIIFELGPQTHSAVTNALGIATVSFRLGYEFPPTVLGYNYTIDATFPDDDPCWVGSLDSDVFTVLQEDARVTYTGKRFASTLAGNSGEAKLLLAATICDITSTPDAGGDSDPGSIANATVTFVDRNGGAISPPLPVIWLPGDTTKGTVAYEWNVNIGLSECETFDVGIVVGNYYLRDDGADDVEITICKPGNQFVTGGGYIDLESSWGYVAGDNGTRCNFGYDTKFQGRNDAIKGNINVMYRRSEIDGLHNYQIKGLDVVSLGIDPGSDFAEFCGTAKLTDVTAGVVVIPEAMFIVKMTDNGNPGRNDLIGIALYALDGALIFSSNWNGLETVQQHLNGGNIKVHSSGMARNIEPVQEFNDKIVDANSIISDAYPNPFMSKLEIGFALPESGRTFIEVISLAGEVIVIEDLGTLDGDSWYTWDFEADAKLSSGTFIYRIISGSYTASGSVILVK